MECFAKDADTKHLTIRTTDIGIMVSHSREFNCFFLFAIMFDVNLN